MKAYRTSTGGMDGEDTADMMVIRLSRHDGAENQVITLLEPVSMISSILNG